MVTMSNSIMTVNVLGDKASNSNGVIKRQVGNQTYVGYLHTLAEQVATGEWGFFKVYDDLKLRRKFVLKERSDIDEAFNYIKELNLDYSLEVELHVFLLDMDFICSERFKVEGV